MRIGLAVLLCLLLQGCWFIYIPAGLFSGPNLQTQLDNFAKDVEAKPTYTAVAVAKDASKWAFGGAYGAGTAAAASAMALDYCNNSRKTEGVSSQCHLYRVNGLAYAGRD